MDDSLSTLKRCNRCKQFLPLTAYTVDRNKKDGWRTICRVCTKAPKITPEPVPEGYKRCSDCKQIKLATAEFFNKTALYQSPDRLNRQCIECRKEYRRERGKSTPRIALPKCEIKHCSTCDTDYPATFDYYCFDRQTADRLRFECRICSQKRSREFRESDGGIQWRKQHNTTHRESNRAYRRQYHQRRKLQERAYKQRYYVLHRDHYREYGKHYYRTHKEAKRVRVLNRIARKKQVPGIHTAQQIREQLKRQDYRCYYAACGHAKFERCAGKYVYHLDHTFPLSRVAGSDIPANDISYLVLACPSCNMSKGDKFPWEWPEGGRLL